MSWVSEIAEGLSNSRGCVIFVGTEGITPWVAAELDAALVLERDKIGSEESFLLVPVLLPGLDDDFDERKLPLFIRTKSWIDLRAGIDSPDGIDSLVDAIVGNARPSEVADTPCPYPGLDPFTASDASRFFGRSSEIDSLVERLDDSGFVGVVGASGSGKSSLVAAGLFGSLNRRNGLRPQWTMCHVRPGRSPVRRLAAGVAGIVGAENFGRIEADLRSDPTAIAEWLSLAAPDQSRLLLFIDQAEELFSTAMEETELGLFASAVAAAVDVTGPTRVVCCIRSDYYQRLADRSQLASLFERSQLILRPPNREQLGALVVEPARAAGLVFQPGLVGRIIDDVIAQPGGLPLLQEALVGTWSSRSGRTMTLAGYQSVGGVKGAIAAMAERAYMKLSIDERQVAQRILLRLVHLGPQGQVTRRHEARVAFGDDPNGASVLRALTEARLLTTASGLEDVPTVELAHEALLQAWPRLVEWVDQRRDDLQTRTRIVAASSDWDQTSDTGYLLRGISLRTATELLASARLDLTESERRLIDASVVQERREKQAEQAQELAEVRRRWLFALGTLALLAVAAASAALYQRQLFQTESRVSRSYELASRGDARREQQPELGLLLLRQAVQTDLNELTGEALRRALLDPVTPLSITRTGANAPLAFSSDERSESAAWLDHEGTLYATDGNGEPKAARPLGGDGFVVALSPGGDYGLISTRNGDAAVFDAGLVTIDSFSLNPPTAIALGPGAELIISGDADGVLRVENRAGANIFEHRLTGRVVAVTISRDGRLVAGTSSTGEVVIHDLVDSVDLTPESGVGSVLQTLAFDPSGLLLAAGTSGGDVVLWRLGANQSPVFLKLGHAVTDLDFTGKQSGSLVASDQSGRVTYWDLTRRQIEREFTAQPDAGRLPMTGVAVVGGNRLLAVRGDGVIFSWSLVGGSPLGHVLGDDSSARSGSGLSASAKDGSVGWVVGDDLIVVRREAMDSTIVFDHNVPLTAVALATASEFHIGDRDGLIHRLDASGSVSAVKAHDGPVRGLARDPISGTLASFGEDGTIAAWSDDLREVARFELAGVADVAVSANGRLLAAASAGGLARLWSIDDRSAVADLVGHTGPVDSIVFLPDGDRVATGSDDRTIRLWDVGSGQQVALLEGHLDRIYDLAVDPSGELLISASEDETARVWRLADMSEVEPPLTSDGGTVWAVAVVDESTVAAVQGPVVRRWDLRTDSLSVLVCDLVGWGLTADDSGELRASADTPCIESSG